MSTLIELNALRIAAGMKPLKSWKESKAKLDAAVTKLSKTMPVKETLKASVELTAPEKETIKKLDKAVKKGVAAERTAKSVDGVSISTIATKLGIDPKVARAKLRRQEDVPCIEGSQWLFKASDVSKIEALLKGDARKKD